MPRRHDIPGINEYVFPNEVDPTDLEGLRAEAFEKTKYVKELHLYVTGLTVALVEVINVCYLQDIELTLFHYNRETGDYYPQEVLNNG